jgi:tetratricopeptide (TPR) repeat protein
MANRTLALRTAGPAVALALLPAAAGATSGLTPTYNVPGSQQAAPPLAVPSAPSVTFGIPGRSIVPGVPPPRKAPAARPAAPPDPAAAVPAPAPEPPPRPGIRVLPTGGIKVETAALMVSGQEGGPIPLAAVAYPFPAEGGRARVAVVVEIEGSALLAKQNDGLLRAEVVLYALDPQGGLAGSAERTIEVDLAQLGGEVRDGGLKVLGEVALPPGAVSLRILVRNATTGDMGLRVLPLVVPAFSGPALVAPVLLAPREPWLVVTASGAGRPGPFAAVLPAAAGEGSAELPAALPILTPDREVKAELPAYQMGAAADLRIEILGSAGRIADLPAHTVARRATAIPGLEVLTVSFTPHGIPEGRYALRARAGETVSGAGQFLILPDGGGGRAWAELTAISRAQANGQAAPSASASAAARVRARRRKPATAALLATYQQALGRVAGGDVAGASAAIADLEVKSLTGGEEMLTELELRELELDALHGWTGGGRERLTQILAVYELLYRDAWTRQRFLTAGHSGEMVIHLVDSYVKSGIEDARKVGAELLIALTPRASGAGLSELVQRALNRALDLDRDNEAALLCLAVDAERRGRYVDAVRWLERLAKAHPESREGRLRLALNLEKQGHRGEAERRLRALAEDRGAEADWIAAVAWQELARAEIAGKRLDVAERTIAAGLARLPGDEKLELERAYLLDLRGQPGRAEEVLGPDRSPAPATSGSSARLRYDELPQELLDRSWEEVRHGLAVRFPSLAGLLNAPERSAEVLP